MTTAFVVVVICIHILQFVSMTDAYVYARRNGTERNRWQLLAMFIDVVVIAWGVWVLVSRV